MNMSPISPFSLRLAFAAAASLLAAACASQPTPPAAAAAPPSQAFQQASTPGVTAPQGEGDDGVMFVEQEHKSPTVHGDDTPITNLNANQQTARPKP
jgi:hypothetical protein